MHISTGIHTFTKNLSGRPIEKSCSYTMPAHTYTQTYITMHTHIFTKALSNWLMKQNCLCTPAWVSASFSEGNH